MIMAKYSKSLWPFIEQVCERDQISIKGKSIEKDMVEAELICSEDRSMEVLEDAMCEVQRDTTVSKIPVYSYNTLKNKEKLHRLMKLNGKRGFHVLKQDYDKCKKECLI